MKHEAFYLGDGPSPCETCGDSNALFRCLDCFSCSPPCQSCIILQHAHNVLHRLQVSFHSLIPHSSHIPLKSGTDCVRKFDLLHLCFSLNFYFLMFLSQFPSMFPLLTYCQEIGLVAIMFFFELLFSYFSSSISFYIFFANLSLIILFPYLLIT